MGHLPQQQCGITIERPRMGCGAQVGCDAPPSEPVSISKAVACEVWVLRWGGRAPSVLSIRACSPVHDDSSYLGCQPTAHLRFTDLQNDLGWE